MPSKTPISPVVKTTLLSISVLPLLCSTAVAVQAMPNSCPVDGCEVSITEVKPEDGELRLTFIANFTPDNAKNHFHVWWGGQYDVKQVGRNAQSEFGVVQGKWHRHDNYPSYVTTGGASMAVRGNDKTLCVTAADRNHNVLDAKLFHCVDISAHL